MIPATFTRLLSRGDLPDSAGGLYNPGAWTAAAGDVCLIVRREVDYSWTAPCYPTLIALNGSLRVSIDPLPYTLVPTGFHAGTRVEDFRPFQFGDQHLIAHVAYRPGSQEPVRQRLSTVGNFDDPGPLTLERFDDWHLPVPPQPIEKNWVLASNGTDLFCVYSLDPLWVFQRRSNGTWTQVVSQVTGLTKAFGKPLRNSTHLLPLDGGYLGFYHYILDRQYVTGAYWLNQNLSLEARTGILLDSDDVTAETPGGVYKPGVRYVSSAIHRGEDLLLFAGVGDAHSEVITVKTADVLARLA